MWIRSNFVISFEGNNNCGMSGFRNGSAMQLNLKIDIPSRFSTDLVSGRLEV
jgi:hypothetical protein